MKSEAIYARQSLEKKDSLSIDGQIKQCEAMLKKENPLIYKDEGFSGKNTERPALKRLIQDIETGKIEKVIVYKLDRISRNIADFYRLYEIMEKNKCEFVSASEYFDTSSAMGKAMMGILAIFAQMERENIQKRVKDNYYYRTAQTGSWAGGPAPYGFKNGRNEQGKPTLIPIKEEIEAVEWMFALYYGVEHCSLGEVARNLNIRGYKPHKRDVFDSVTVSKILQNPIYVKADNLLYKYFKSRERGFTMKELKKFTWLNDEDFGKLVKCFLYYMENKDLPIDIDDRSEQLFNTTIKKKCDRQIKDTERKRNELFILVSLFLSLRELSGQSSRQFSFYVKIFSSF